MKPKLFDETDVLEKVIELFWQHGFDGTSMQMLQECMGLSRASIYHTFKNKNELFRRALTQYLEVIGNEYQRCLYGSDTFEKGFEKIVKHLTKPTRTPRGCLLVLSTLEMSRHETETQTLIHQAHKNLYAMILNRLKQDHVLEPENKAKRVCVEIYGLLVMHKAGLT